VPYYLIEVYVPRARAHEAGATGRRLRAEIAAVHDGDVELRFVRTMLLPDDEACFHVVDSPSRMEVQSICERAGLSSMRIVSVVEDPSGDDIVLDPGHTGTDDGGPSASASG
jgi:N-acetylmuramoyl-L-alanine amidase